MNAVTAINRVLGHEGGYVNNIKDPGGETNWGITVRVARANGYTGPMRDMPRSVAVAIYRKMYWDTIRGDELPFATAFQVFDAGVNHGVSRAVEWLQQAVGTKTDGKIGPLTIAAAKATDEADVMLRFNAIRLKFYTSLPTWPTFGRGWANRVAGNLDYAMADTK